MPNNSFAERMKSHQTTWWKRRYGMTGMLEEREDGKAPWVLKDGYKEKNLHGEERWWRYIEGKEHKWVRSLNSSQCFAVNIFGPLKDDLLLARLVLAELIPDRGIRQDDEVTVHFEHTPEGAKGWLGETKTNQPTQVDVFFTVLRKQTPVGYLLAEIKLTESKFGSCRGAMESTLKRPGNPDHTRCNNLAKVFQDPDQQCWIAGEQNGRLYWDFMKRTAAPFRFPGEGACPFRHGLYQLMRNQILAMALLEKKKAEWAEVAVCIHPGNDRVYQLIDPVAGEAHALRAFNALLPVQAGKIRELDPLQIVQTVSSNDSNLSGWSDWVIGRYNLLKHTTQSL